jgi:putative oxidoreductase
MSVLSDFLILVGRICISALFLWAGSAKILHWKGTLEYMQSKKIKKPSLLLPLAIIIQMLGGLSLLLGYYTRIGALLLILFIIPSAINMHDFWNVPKENRTVERTLFMKDVAIFGSLLLLLVTGSGRFSWGFWS